MIDADRGKVELDLQDGEPALVLWYPNGALRAIEKAIGKHMTFGKQLGESLDANLTTDTLPVYVAAGRLWEDRNFKPDAHLRERLDWTRRPVAEIYQVVSRAMYAGLTGEEPRKPADPPVPEVTTQPSLNGSGAGVTSSNLPSVS
jgi:hypothetical protein